MRKLKQRGALFIEYALVMAFVTAIGVSFISDNFFAKEINDIFNRVAKVMNLAVNQQRELASIDDFVKAVSKANIPLKVKNTNNNTVTSYANVMDFLTCDAYKTFQMDSENPAKTTYHAVFEGEKGEMHNITSMVTESLIREGYIDSDKYMWGIDRLNGDTRTMWITDIRPSEGWNVNDPILVKQYSIHKDGTIELVNDNLAKNVTKKTKKSAATGKDVTYYSFF